MRQLFVALAPARAFACLVRISSDRAAILAGCLAVGLAVTACKPEPPSAHVRPEAQTRVASKAVPKPARSLMAREAAPQCLYAESAHDSASPEPAPTAQINPAVATTADVTTNEEAERRARERDCFRDAEMRVRAKLAKLQASVRTTLKAIDQNEPASSR